MGLRRAKAPETDEEGAGPVPSRPWRERFHAAATAVLVSSRARAGRTLSLSHALIASGLELVLAAIVRIVERARRLAAWSWSVLVEGAARGRAVAAVLREAAIEAGQALAERTRPTRVAFAARALRTGRKAWVATRKGGRLVAAGSHRAFPGMTARRYAVGAVVMVSVLGAGAVASARYDKADGAGPELALADTVLTTGIRAPRPGETAFASGVGSAQPFGRVPGRPCTPRRLAIQALGSVEEGVADEPPSPAFVDSALPVVDSFAATGGGPAEGTPGFTSAGGPSVGQPPVAVAPFPPPGPVPAVPEPGTWLLMIVGFGAVGAALRRRARLSPAA